MSTNTLSVVKTGTDCIQKTDSILDNLRIQKL